MSSMWWGWIAALGALVACSDSAPDNPLVVRSGAASAAECPHGGSIVASGLDGDGDGALDDGEITVRTVICNAPPVAPPPIVVRLVAEPAGARCALAGTAVQSGPDRNGNGGLDDEEVERVEYACGEPLLTRLAEERAGERCIAGGVAFLIGRDRDRDGRLGDAEVEHTELECGTALSRDVAVRSAADAAALAGITAITGSLTVDGTGLTQLALPRLVVVRGALEVTHNDALTRLAMPALRSIDGRFALEHARQLATIDLPQLRHVGSLSLVALEALHDLSGVPVLHDVGADCRIADNAALVSAELPLERIGGGLAIEGNPQLVHTSWSLDRGIASVRITSNARLEAIELVTSELASLDALIVSSNAQLARLTVSSGQLGAIEIAGNPRLADVSMTAFEISGDVALHGNGPMQLTLPGSPMFALLIHGSLSLSGPIETVDNGMPILVRGDWTAEGTALSSLARPEYFLQIAGALRLLDNAQLTTSPGVVLGGDLEVRGNAALTDLAFLRGDLIDGDVSIVDNASLRAARSLEAVTWIRGDVQIASNPLLKEIFSPALQRIDGALVLDGNASLAQPGLERLQQVASLTVAGCASLTGLDLLALSEVGSRIDVTDNAVLGACDSPWRGAPISA